MSSKQFSSILNTVPSATARPVQKEDVIKNKKQEPEELVKIVARVPVSLKEELKQYTKNNKGETESGLIIKGLIKLGFTVENDFTLDRRKLR
jgi:hypothetical protein